MAASEGSATRRDSITIAIGTPLDEADRALVLAALEYCGGVRKRAAAMLGISPKTLYNRLVAYRDRADKT